MVIRRRLLFWLVKAYIKKWGKVIAVSFVVGLLFFFALIQTSRVLIHLVPIEKKVSVGMVGAYTLETLPQEIVVKLSKGLTKVEPNGRVVPDIAKSWDVKDGGKTYIFTLRDDITFGDGQKLTSKKVQYDFADVQVERPDDYTIVYRLKDPYSPFLVTVAKPIFHDNYLGLGDYKLNDVELNGQFIKSIELVSRKNKYNTDTYSFYPSEDALKVAFALGEISVALGMTSTGFNNDINFTSFPKIQINKKTNYQKLVTLFYNNRDNTLSDPKLRSALSYALPENFPEGENASIPYPPNSLFANKDVEKRIQDLDHSKLLLSADDEDTSSSNISVTIKTLSKYKKVAESISKEWRKVGINTTIEEVSSKPDTFQIYLGDFSLPRDPDQYTLWHSAQTNNITRFRDLRVDKLLEDGRKITNPQERIKIYQDFQKYLLEDTPADFLYFPYEYDIVRE